MANEFESEKAEMNSKLAQEKEKRIEHTKDMAIRRIAKRELSKGWTAWRDGYLEQKRLQRALKAAGNKMLRPKFVALLPDLAAHVAGREACNADYDHRRALRTGRDGAPDGPSAA